MLITISSLDFFHYRPTLTLNNNQNQVAGKGTRDLCGPSGLTTEAFIETVSEHMQTGKIAGGEEVHDPKRPDLEKVDMDAVKKMFDQYDSNADGTIDMDEFVRMLVKLHVAPMKE